MERYTSVSAWMIPLGSETRWKSVVPGASLSVLVAGSDILPVPVSVIKVDGKGRDHDIVIPFDTNLQLRVHSKVFAIADEKGAAVDKTNGAVVPIQIPSGTTPVKILFRITGV